MGVGKGGFLKHKKGVWGGGGGGGGGGLGGGGVAENKQKEALMGALKPPSHQKYLDNKPTSNWEGGRTKSIRKKT